MYTEVNKFTGRRQTTVPSLVRALAIWISMVDFFRLLFELSLLYTVDHVQNEGERVLTIQVPAG